MNNYFLDSELSSKKNGLFEGFDSNSTIEANPITQLRKLEQAILNMFNMAKKEIATIYQLVCTEVSRLIRAAKYGKNHNSEFLDNIMEIRSLTQETMIDLPRQIRKILIGPQIFHSIGNQRNQFIFSRSTSKSKLSRSLDKKKLSGLPTRNKSLDNSDSFINSTRSKSSTRVLKFPKKKSLQNLDFLVGQWDQLQEINLTKKGLSFFQPLLNVRAPHLKTLIFSDNRILNLESFKGAYFPHLLTLDLSINKLKNISGLQQTNFPSLQRLDLSRNYISSIEGLGQCSYPFLTELNLAKNKIKSIGVLKQTSFSKLQILNVDSNELISLQPLLECSLLHLKVLSFSSNNVMSLKFVDGLKVKNLQALIGNNNSIKYLEPLCDAKFPNITSIILNDNKLSDISPLAKTYFPRLKELDLENNQIKRQEMGCFLRMQKDLREVRRKYPFLQL